MDTEKKQLRDEVNKRNALIGKHWQTIATKYPEAVQDFVDYAQNLATFYRRCAEDQEMHGLPLDDHKVSSLLQQARTCDIVITYMTSRIDSNVAQPIKKLSNGDSHE